MALRYRRPLEVLIFGTGAVGAIFGWRLAQHPDVRVSVVCRSNYERIKKHGVDMDTRLWGLGTFRPHRVVNSVSEVQDVSNEYIICANKIVHSNEVALEDATRPVVRPETTLVSVQNGINVEQPLRNAFHEDTILSAICNASCQQMRPGLVQQASQIRPHAFHIGVFSHSFDAPLKPEPVQSREPNNTELEASKLRVLVRLDDKFKEAEDIGTER